MKPLTLITDDTTLRLRESAGVGCHSIKENRKMVDLVKHVAANNLGSDYIVGDLHGCLDLLKDELARIGFDQTKDRLFSVGDLIDRGTDSLGCLRLLREPWFFAVRGNHEEMLIDYAYEVVLPYGSRTFAPIFFHNGGRWAEKLSPDENRELRQELLPRVVALPYVIVVGSGETQFNIAHAELMTGKVDDEGLFTALAETPFKLASQRILTDAQLSNEAVAHTLEPLTWGRRVINRVKRDTAQTIDTFAGPLLISHQPMHAGLSLTYVGHTPLEKMTLHKSHLFIDRGAYKREANTCLLVLKHEAVLSALAAWNRDRHNSM